MPNPSEPGPTAARRIRLVLQYEGTEYAGWQLQENARTVQEAVEEAVRSVVGHPARVHGAGRTDAGVHALGQVAHFETTSGIPEDALKRALNARLPRDIAVREAAAADPAFHARFSARGKTYVYVVRNHPDPSALDRRFHWHVRPRLDDGAMREAAAPLLGRHDFRSFASLEGERNPVRELRRIEIRREGAYLYFVFEADSFLWKMARGLAGSLVEVGRGKRPVGWLAEALAGLDRARGGPSAPARGLVLLGVDYGGGAAAGAGSLPPPWPGFFLAGA